ncbi:19460_t:CDS:10 [Gigaspora margarita]|uniref:19460_t:CDS:1 n=1 Tax=Gigaspora margarita TaxID=4874 RepID=A0ABM8VZH3_GIGMA|nr:19460_t:CDS:10 [Gigaspora margarita]
MSEQQVKLACLLKDDNPFTKSFFVEIEKNEINIPIDQINALQQFIFKPKDLLFTLKMIDKCFDGKILENCLHIVIQAEYTKREKKEDVQSDVIQSFCRRLDSLPLAQDLENQIYDEWKKQIPMLEKYFCNEDKENKTANWLSSKCESAKDQEYMELESALTSKYDNLINDIWDTLKRGVAFKIDRNRKVKEHTAEEKAHSSNFSKARDELLERMGNWNNLFYGQVIKWNNNTYITIVSEEIVLKEIKCFNEYIYNDFETLEKAYAAISNSNYSVYAKEEPRLKTSYKCSCNEESSQTYYVQLTPVCHKRLPHNEKELRNAILAILNALNILHRRDLVHRDIRWDNVLISNENTYNLYDRKCDLFLVGKLFDQLSFNFSLDAQELCGYLKQQRFDNCNEVLAHNWFQHDT